ncbi:hypothetical protein HDU85_003804 [Gaertneriomyces sp. JEL0708]|nr:hypothetical protein HDU85_003804 [Gaertneriomyces sp. JEL0708]
MAVHVTAETDFRDLPRGAHRSRCRMPKRRYPSSKMPQEVPFATFQTLPPPERARLAALIRQLVFAESQKQELSDAAEAARLQVLNMEQELGKVKEEKDIVYFQSEELHRRLRDMENLLREYEDEIGTLREKVEHFEVDSREDADCPGTATREEARYNDGPVKSSPLGEIEALVKIQAEVTKILEVLSNQVVQSSLPLQANPATISLSVVNRSTPDSDASVQGIPPKAPCAQRHRRNSLRERGVPELSTMHAPSTSLLSKSVTLDQSKTSTDLTRLLRSLLKKQQTRGPGERINRKQSEYFPALGGTDGEEPDYTELSEHSVRRMNKQVRRFLHAAQGESSDQSISPKPKENADSKRSPRQLVTSETQTTDNNAVGTQTSFVVDRTHVSPQPAAPVAAKLLHTPHVIPPNTPTSASTVIACPVCVAATISPGCSLCCPQCTASSAYALEARPQATGTVTGTVTNKSCMPKTISTGYDLSSISPPHQSSATADASLLFGNDTSMVRPLLDVVREIENDDNVIRGPTTRLPKRMGKNVSFLAGAGHVPDVYTDINELMEVISSLNGYVGT